MEPNINDINETELIDETIEEIELNAAEAAAEDDAEIIERDDRRRGRGRGHRGPGGRRPFGPNRPYRFALFVEEDGSYVLRSPDLADRTAQVGSLDEIGAAMQAAIEQRAAEDAAAAEEAAKDAEYSGKFVLRLPKSMHRQLAELAEAEGVSLNQLALAFLAEGMGKAEFVQELGERRGGRHGHRGGGCGPQGRGPQGRGPRGGRGPEGRGPWGGPEGRGPEGEGFQGRGPGGRGRWGGPEGRGPEGRDFEGRGPRGFGRGPKGRGFGPRGGRGWYASNPFAGEGAPEQDAANDQSFV